MTPTGGDTSLGLQGDRFPLTTMGLVSRLRDISGEARRKALEELITRYWRPVYLYLRMAWKKSNEDAKARQYITNII